VAPRWILGIAGSHNSGVALIKDGEVAVAVQTERLVRRKRQAIRLDRLGQDAAHAIGYCLRHAGIDLPDLAAIATCTPGDAIHPRFDFQAGAPLARAALPRFVTVPHHLAHAEYALHYSPMRPCLVLVCDGSGTYEAQRAELDIAEPSGQVLTFVQAGGKESISAYAFDGRDLRLVYRIAYGEAGIAGDGVPDAGPGGWLSSVGHLWEWCAAYCHGSRHEAGKVMGLAAFGDPDVHADLEILRLAPDGAVSVAFAPLLRQFRQPNSAGADVSGDAHYADLAAHLQQVTNAFLVELVRFLRTRFGSSCVCYSGGVALNGISNECLRRQLDVDLHMNGSCEDNGTAIGAALAVDHALFGTRVAEPVTDLYGRRYSEGEVATALRAHAGRVERLPQAQLLERAARNLAGNRVVGWFQGRSEFGPRALGNRSILADPRSPDMQAILNHRVKRREGFRPYAPAVIEERAAEFFELDAPSPVMLRVVPVRGRFLPAITHVDGTARVQTVNRRQNALFYDLLRAFGAETGVPVLLNTSFNVAGEPIVESPADALRTFVASRMDVLIMGDHLVHPA
jgi:carbamoyltransferase